MLHLDAATYLLEPLLLAGLLLAPATTEAAEPIFSDGFESGDLTAWADPPITIHFKDDFETGNLGHNQNGYRWTSSSGRETGEKPTTSTDIARSGTHSLKFTFIGHASDPSDDAWSEQRFTLGSQHTELYVEWYQYFPEGTEGLGPRYVHRNATGPDNNKLLRLWDDDYNDYRIKLGLSTLPQPNGDSSIISEKGINRTGVGPSGLRSDRQGITNPRRGRWLRFQVHIKLDDGTGNGVLELWIDGEKTIENQNVEMHPTGGVGNYLKNGYLMGWANSGFDLTSSTYIDDFSISNWPLP